jgi:GT2 family glycosyltransferase
LAKVREREAAVAKSNDVEPVVLQPLGDRGENVSVIINDKNGGGGHAGVLVEGEWQT